MARFTGPDAARNSLKDYPNDGELVCLVFKEPLFTEAQWTSNLWPGGAPVNKMFGRNDEIPVTLIGTYHGVTYRGRATGQMMLEIFDERAQTWYAFQEPTSGELFETYG